MSCEYLKYVVTLSGCGEMDLLMAMGLTVVHLISLQALYENKSGAVGDDDNDMLVNQSFVDKVRPHSIFLS